MCHVSSIRDDVGKANRPIGSGLMARLPARGAALPTKEAAGPVVS